MAALVDTQSPILERDADLGHVPRSGKGESLSQYVHRIAAHYHMRGAEERIAHLLRPFFTG